MAAPTTLANSDIITLAAAGVPDSVLLTMIYACPAVTFDISVSGITALASAKISGPVIHAMQMKVAQGL